MKLSHFLWIAMILVVLDVVLPYWIALSSISFGAMFFFQFWCLLTVAVIVYAIIHTQKWRDR